MPYGKPWYTSKTVLLGVITIGISILELVHSFLQTADFSAAGIVLLVIGILTVINRFFTNQPIK